MATTIKEFLYQIRYERREAKNLEDQIGQLYLQTLPAGIRYDKDKIQASHSQDPMGDEIVEAEELRSVYAERLNRLYADIRYAMSLVACLADSRERMVIDLYFLAGEDRRMEDVAVIMNYSVQQIWRIYSDALEHLEQMRVNES